jgi:GntR family transcriptional regulator, transcriptional repressor for pyruvate dehydrogenase complex
MKKAGHAPVPPVEDTGSFGALVLDRQKLNEQIAEMIQQQITHGKLKPGDRLPPERELATLLKVNRATVREAIHLLGERGLVERKNGRGTSIMAMDPRNVGAAIHRFCVSNNCSQRELLEFRTIFEPKVAAFAASNANADDIKKLGTVLRLLEEAWLEQDLARLASADAQFHLTVAAASHNTLMLAVASGLSIVLERSMKMSHASSHSEESFRTHRIIYRAVAHHDPAKAEQAMRQQFELQPVLEARI